MLIREFRVFAVYGINSRAREINELMALFIIINYDINNIT